MEEPSFITNKVSAQLTCLLEAASTEMHSFLIRRSVNMHKLLSFSVHKDISSTSYLQCARSQLVIHKEVATLSKQCWH